MADNFFQDDTQEQVQEEIEKIKVGEKEYTTEELNRLVGLGEIAVEAEEKYNRPISKFWPEYTYTKQELEKKEAELQELRKSALPKQQEVLTDQEQVTVKVREELGKLGYIPANEVEERARKIASEVVSGYKLLEEVNQIVAKNAEEGNPQTSSDDLLSFMQEKNISDPHIAYKIKFEKELDAIKEKKLSTIRPSGLITEPSSTAGGKQPTPVKITKQNLGNVLDEYLKPRNI